MNPNKHVGAERSAPPQSSTSTKKIVHFDMDNVLVDFKSGAEKNGIFYKRVIFSRHKDLNKGNYLINGESCKSLLRGQ
jgi:hypothetical protein